MSDAIRQHTIKYPHARTSTVRYLVQREEMTKRLREEVEAAKRLNEFRDSIGWKRPAIIDRMLSAFGIGRR